MAHFSASSPVTTCRDINRRYEVRKLTWGATRPLFGVTRPHLGATRPRVGIAKLGCNTPNLTIRKSIQK